MPYSLTPAMADCARVIFELTALDGRPPSYREVGRELGLSSGNVFALCDRLEQRDWLAPRRPSGPLVLLHPPPPAELGPLEITAEGRAWLEEARHA